MDSTDRQTSESGKTPSASEVLAVALCLVLIAVSGLVIYRSLVVKTVYYDPLGPAGLPIAVSLIISGLCAFYVVSHARLVTHFRQLFAGIDGNAFRHVVQCLISIIAYVFVVSLKAVPFAIPTFAILVVLSLTVATEPRRRVRRILVMALATTIIVHVIFVDIFMFDLG